MFAEGTVYLIGYNFKVLLHGYEHTILSIITFHISIASIPSILQPEELSTASRYNIFVSENIIALHLLECIARVYCRILIILSLLYEFLYRLRRMTLRALSRYTRFRPMTSISPGWIRYLDEVWSNRIRGSRYLKAYSDPPKPRPPAR